MENEMHFLVECPFYKVHRRRILDKLKMKGYDTTITMILYLKFPYQRVK